MKARIQTNPYLAMTIERVRQDAIYGVALAREALAARDPASARALGVGVSAKEAKRKSRGNS